MVPIPASDSLARPAGVPREPHTAPASVRRNRTYRLLLDGHQLSDALRLLLKTRSSGTAELTLWFDGEELICALDSASAAVPASGRWPASVSLDESTLIAFREAAGDGARMLTVEDGHLSIGGMRIECRVTPGRGPATWIRRSREVLSARTGSVAALGPVLVRTLRGPAATTASGLTRAAVAASRTGARWIKAATLRIASGWRWVAAAVLVAALAFAAPVDRVTLPGPVYDALSRAGLSRAAPRPTRVAAAAYAAGRTEAAVAGLTDAASRYRSSTAAQIELARIYEDLGDGAAARLLLEQALTRDPHSRQAMLELGRHHFMKGVVLDARADAAGAAQEFEVAVAVLAAADAEDSVAAGWLACALYRVGRSDSAAAAAARTGAGPWLACLPEGGP